MDAFPGTSCQATISLSLRDAIGASIYRALEGSLSASQRVTRSHGLKGQESLVEIKNR